MQRTCRLGSPVAQLSRCAMIASIATAVLPVWRSPMMSSRCPRPIGVIASIAVIPVCNGSFTGWRSTTLAACTSRFRRPSSGIRPLPSSGLPSGSITRPRNPSPTGIDRICPVCLTRSPSSIWADSPSTMQPIWSSSRLNARPSTPPGNSSSSLAIALGRPLTCAMPSPASTTRPTCSRSTEGVKLSTLRRNASAILLGSRPISSIAMGSSLAPRRRPCKVLARLVQARADRAVEDLIADLGDQAAHNVRVDHDPDLDLAPGGLRECVRQLLGARLVQRDGRAHLRHRRLAGLGHHLGQHLHDAAELARSTLLDDEGEHVDGHGVGALAEGIGDQRPLVLQRQRRVREGLAHTRLGLEQPGEREQVAFDRLELDLGGGHAEQSLGVATDELVLARHAQPVFPFPDATSSRYSSIRRWWALASSDWPTTRSASSTDISATSVRSSWNTRSRSARISSWALATVAAASRSALAWTSARTCSAERRASSMILLDSSRALASCCRYCSSSCSAERRVSSARSSSPWILSRRSARRVFTRGTTHFHRKKKTIPKQTAPMISSLACGYRFSFSLCARKAMVPNIRTRLPR